MKGPIQQEEKVFSEAQGPRDNKQLELARMTSDFSLHAPDLEDKFYFLAAKVFEIKIECQIFKCRNFERPRF